MADDLLSLFNPLTMHFQRITVYTYRN